MDLRLFLFWEDLGLEKAPSATDSNKLLDSNIYQPGTY